MTKTFVVSDECKDGPRKKCYSRTKYHATSADHISSDISEDFTKLARDENKEIVNPKVKGKEERDYLIFSYEGALNLVPNTGFFAISELTADKWNDDTAEGVLGLAPSDSSYNILEHMATAGEIDKRMFSIFTDFDGDSSIKFGGFDKSGVLQGADFKMLNSASNDLWMIDMIGMKIAGQDRFGNRATFNPAFPWIYLPPDDFDDFLTYFNKAFKSQGL